MIVAYWADDGGCTLDIVVISNLVSVEDMCWCLSVKVRQNGWLAGWLYYAALCTCCVVLVCIEVF